jgi:hypothetical protein
MSVNKSPTAEDLRALLKRGLPAQTEVIAGHLLALPGVVARSAAPDGASRTAAFNTLLRQLIARMPDRQLSLAAATLFSILAVRDGETLTERRGYAAEKMSRDPDHFRKHIEPRILADLAAALAADSERMTAMRIAPPQLVPVAAPSAPLPEDMFAWEVVEHEEQLSRLWSAVYALRAELLACERLASMDPEGRDRVDAAEAALWRTGQLHVAMRAYRRAYGVRLLHGGIAADKLLGMAGWTPALTPAEVELVCHRGPDAERLRTFITDLTADPAGRAVLDRWVDALLVPHTTVTASGSAA